MVKFCEYLLTKFFSFWWTWMRKDLGICLDTGNETGASLSVTAIPEDDDDYDPYLDGSR